jgi:hypothetical protein
MNTNQARVIDPILTTHARGYSQQGLIFTDLAPEVDVPAQVVTVLNFGKAEFQKMNTRRAMGADALKTAFDYSSDPLRLLEDALDAIVPRELQEEANATVKIDLAAMSINRVLQIMNNGHEDAVAKLAFDAANYGTDNKIALSGSSQFDHADCDPFKLVEDGISAIADQIGRRPNQLTIGNDVFKALKLNRKIRDQIKYGNGSIITADLLASLFGVEKVSVGLGLCLDEGATKAKPIWSKNALLSYVNRDGSYISPAHMYSYRRTGYPIVEKPYWDASKRSWIYGTTQMRTPVIAGKDAGYLFMNAVS